MARATRDPHESERRARHADARAVLSGRSFGAERRCPARSAAPLYSSCAGALFCVLGPHGWAGELDAVCGMDEAVEDGVGECRVAGRTPPEEDQSFSADALSPRLSDRAFISPVTSLLRALTPNVSIRSFWTFAMCSMYSPQSGPWSRT